VLEIGHSVSLGLDYLPGAYDGECHSGNVPACYLGDDEPVNRVARAGGRTGRLGMEWRDLSGDSKDEA